MNRRSRVICLAAFLLCFTLSGSAVMAADDGQGNRSLTILEPSESVKLDPAFEMIMEKLDDDLDHILSAPFRLTQKGTAVAGMTVLTTLFFLDMDEEYLLDFSEERGDRSRYAYGRLAVLGRHIPEVTAGLYLLGYFTGSDRLKSGALEGFEAVAITALLTASSAFIIGHAPPSAEVGSGEFEWLSDYRSMPDINTALTFSLAGVLAYERGWFEQAAYFTIAAGVGAARLYDEEAWPSDVFLGAVLGTVIGRTVASLSHQDGDRLSMDPVVVVDGRAVPGVRLRWEL
jgi:hypothetical protein